ncbi:MAG: hypothetical protein OEZ02_15200, partial [Anaerolineae bacterium]|nr:hypothetical protein [Anaerolineae bacterium]
NTERIDYEAIEDLARQHKPKMLIGGFSSYPWAADWAALRAIADSVGAYLLADMAHVAGLVAGGAYPSPIGHAHVVTSTTHKTLCGPRGAIILTTDRALSRKIDRAVFPGEQGGPHVNVFAALALTFKIAQSKEFSALQHQIIKNCVAFTNQLEARGFRIPFGGTNTHLTNLDTQSIIGPDGTTLSGDMAARILDLAGIVVNRNTIPGDRSALNPNGIRLGTPWITQRGLKEKEVITLAGIIADLLQAATPYKMKSRSSLSRRAKVDFSALEDARLRVRDLAENAGIDFEPTRHGYPHFFYIDDQPLNSSGRVAFELTGDRIRQFLNIAISSDVESLSAGKIQAARLYTPQGEIDATLAGLAPTHFRLSLPAAQSGLAVAWLRDLSDGFMQLDEDILRKSPGPISVMQSASPPDAQEKGDPVSNDKPYFIGAPMTSGDALPEFSWQAEPSTDLKRTPLYAAHQSLGAKMVPFAGWEMPVWYSSVIEEHQAVRQAAGLFDVSHMGVFQAEGPDAPVFLDSVCGGDITGLEVGESTYTHFLDPDANVIDDLLVYRRAAGLYLLVVNASNAGKNWAWLTAVRDGKVLVDRQRPWSRAFGRSVILRNLHHSSAGDDQLVDIALQGPRSRDILLALKTDPDTAKQISKLQRTQLCQANLGGFDLVVSRTGYTGEKMAFELFIHPDHAAALWQALLKVGEPLGLKPCGLGARDSLRTEAGLPLYGHEIGGDLNLGVGEAGFRNYVKTYKPWFIGRSALLAKEAKRDTQVIRFRFPEKGVRLAHLGDPVL